VQDPLITQSPDVLSGTPVFHGTRVPVQNLIDYLSTDETVEAFLADFPTVSHEQVLNFLVTAQNLMIAHANENSDR